VSGTYGVENTNASPSATLFNVTSLIDVTMPAGGLPGALNPSFEYSSPTLAAFDGAIDFSGPSAATGTFADATGTGSPSLSVDLYQTPFVAAYVGPSGAPGTIVIALSATDYTDSSPSTGPGIAHTHTLAARAIVRVDYDYNPHPTSFCFSNPWSECPCGNAGAAGHGCAHSFNPSGALLSVSGNASISNDTLALNGSGMTVAAALYFQGSTMDYVGSPYGDGLRCVSGAIVRLGLVMSPGGASSLPSPGGPSLSVRGGITTPGTLAYYQVQYRNAAAFCTSATYNATNGVAVSWGP
jgi:hypothetical protein